MKYIVFSIAILTLLACDKELNNDINIPYAGDKLVLNGYISSDSVNFQITKSISLEKGQKLSNYLTKSGKVWIKNASDSTIIILNNSINGVDFKQYTKILKENQKYKIFASADNLTTVESNWITIPTKTLIDKTSQVKNTLNCDCNRLLIDFKDNIALKNYYSFNLLAMKNKQISNFEVFLSDAKIQENNCYNKKVFSDACFNGSDASIEYGFFRNNNQGQLIDSLFLRFGSVSEEAYLLSQNRLKDDNGFIEGLNDAPPTYTNIKDGYGVVFAQNWKIYKIALQK